jgi:hypothetical protein
MIFGQPFFVYGPQQPAGAGLCATLRGSLAFGPAASGGSGLLPQATASHR